MFKRNKVWQLGPLYRVAYVLLTPLLAATTRIHMKGAEKLPAGGFILVSNHLSNMDPLVQAYAFGIRGYEIRFLAKAELFKVPVLGKILHKWGMVPVNRNSGSAGKSLDAAAQAVEAGQIISIFPEGTITLDPAFWPMKMKTGAARLALATGHPLVPVVQWGTQDVMDRHTPFMRLKKSDVFLQVLPPIEPANRDASDEDRQAVQNLTAEMENTIMEGVSRLRGQAPPETVWNPKELDVPDKQWGRFSSWRRQLARNSGRQDILAARQ